MNPGGLLLDKDKPAYDDLKPNARYALQRGPRKQLFANWTVASRKEIFQSHGGSKGSIFRQTHLEKNTPLKINREFWDRPFP